MNILRRRSSSTSKKPSSTAIFKKFMEFLQTDVWRLPTINFLENNSILFNREQADHDLCVKAHQQYMDLVDALIESYCLDAGITAKDLVEALKVTDQSTRLSEKEKRLLEPVVAAQDFNVFVPLMTRINIELQLQAIKMLEHVCGVQSTSFTFTDDELDLWQSLFEEDKAESYIIISVLKQSKEEFEQDEKLRKILQEVLQSSADEVRILENQRSKEIALLDSAINGTAQLSIQDGDIPEPSNLAPTTDQQSKLTAEQPKSTEQPKSITKHPKITEQQKTPGKPEITRRKLSSVKSDTQAQKKPPMPSVKSPLRPQKLTSLDGGEASNQQPSFDFRNLLEKREGLSEDLLKQRAEYLRQQRDRLLEAKQKEREKQLIEAVQRNANDRPKTSQAARGAMKGEQLRSNQQSGSDMLEARRALANRIREQIVGTGERSENK